VQPGTAAGLSVKKQEKPSPVDMGSTKGNKDDG